VIEDLICNPGATGHTAAQVATTKERAMALSDACAEFIEAPVEGELSHKPAVKWLAAEVESYDGEPWGYDRGEIEKLRDACATVLEIPSGATASRSAWLGALVRLVVLAEQVRAYHDTPPSRAEVAAAA
jgi:hypothetical protein